ncbi:PREDICTED: DNA mismatch repair protein Msh2 [Ceratosolen solmsi marchali]|uniref:DNA mismatch repair protein MSH2 n=1 Tax=Ceratosolen solmsi marchali TaxID=326594 RepID=A0AAJ6VKR2_9HYME|nr:PREDICTED: DNA mismatch repair protein Msh2 [Ceratosolen solmsi marchali]
MFSSSFMFQKPNSTIRIFDRSDYYTLHGNDALFAAKEIFKTTSVCKKIGPEHNKIDGVILNKNHFETFIRDLLLVKQYRVEVYVNNGSAKNQDWNVEYKGSPGNLAQFEEVLFNNNDVAVESAILAVKVGSEGTSKIVGVSCIDSIKSIISVSEFEDGDSFMNLETIVVLLKPKECVLQVGEGNTDFQIVKQLMERNNVLVTPKKKRDFSTDSLVQDLNNLLRFNKGQQRNSQALPEINLKRAMAATASLISYLNLTASSGEGGLFTLEEIPRNQYLRLDAAAIKALNLEPSGRLGASANSSLLGLLDKCKTALGKRLLAQWIRQPLRDLALINERHEVVEALVADTDTRSTLSEDYLGRIPDLHQLAKKLGNKKAGLQECYRIYQCMMYLPLFLEKLNALAHVPAVKAMIFDSLRESIEEMDKFQQMVEQTIDLDSADRGDFLVKAEFDDELKVLKSEMDDIENKIQKVLHKAANDLGMESGKSIKLELNPRLGYLFRITLNEEKNIRNNKSYTVVNSIKGGIRFKNKNLEILNDEYLSKKNSYTSQQKLIVAEIVETAAGYVPPIKVIGGIIATLDVLNSFAQVAVSASEMYVRPKMLSNETQELRLVKVRHPCLEIQDGVNYIANDAHFTKDSRFHIITGPNMGGKSTYIRSIGVTALMAHIGSFVPCERATISILDSILARIGADDSQIRGLSTFMAEMVETSAILRTATSNSLVIIDELGRGTSTYDGCGIAWAIAEHLAKNVKSYCLFATHFHEITRLAEDVPSVNNFHVTALVDEKLVLLYKVKPGICDQSFGIHVARMANFPDDVIEFAKQKQAELEDLQGAVFEGSDNPEKKRNIINDGEKMIKDFMEKCTGSNESFTDEELINRVRNLKEEVLAHNNPYIKALLGMS